MLRTITERTTIEHVQMIGGSLMSVTLTREQAEMLRRLRAEYNEAKDGKNKTRLAKSKR